MDGKAPKVTKEVLCEEARFILANVLAEGRYGRQNKYADIKRICEGAVSISFGDYVGFLEAAGYLTHDKGNDTLDVSGDGERVVTGERLSELMERAVAHFKSRRQAAGGQARVTFTGSSSALGASGPTTNTSALPPPSPSSSSVNLPPPPDTRSSSSSSMGGAPSMSPSATPAPSSRYEKLAPLGSGGIGTVHLARQIPFDREVSLKEIRDVFAFFSDEARREIVRRFGEVIRAAARLSHPNIVPMYDVSPEGSMSPFIVTEFMPQGSVRRLIADAEDIPSGLVVKYLLQTLHALKAAHAQGVVHRGLKPENLLIDAHGNVKVSDFGMTRIVERDAQHIKQVYLGMGAVAYMAPELFTAPDAAGQASDIYALGIIFYEMLTRKLPGRRSPMPSELGVNLPKGLDDIFDRMTRDERGDRYGAVEDILEDFYKVEGIERMIEGHYAVLFGDNPLQHIKFRTAAPGVDGGAVAADGGGAAGGEGGGGEGGEGGGNPRATGRRPYSYQQRLKGGGTPPTQQ